MKIPSTSLTVRLISRAAIFYSSCFFNLLLIFSMSQKYCSTLLSLISIKSFSSCSLFSSLDSFSSLSASILMRANVSLLLRITRFTYLKFQLMAFSIICSRHFWIFMLTQSRSDSLSCSVPVLSWLIFLRI